MVQREPFTLASLRDDAFDFTVYDSYAAVPDRPGPRGGEGRCLARRSARSARSSRSSTPGRPRTSPSTRAGRRSATPSRRAPTRASRSRRPSCPSTKKKLWSRRALFTSEAGGRFTDKDFHAYLHQQGVERETTPKRTEWHHFADRAEDVAGVLQRLRRPGLRRPPAQRRGGRLRPAPRAAGGRRPGRGRLRGREGRGAVERQAAVRQDADDVRPDADPGRPAGPDRHQPPGDRELLVRRLHALHRPPDDVPVRLGVALTGRPFAHDPRAVACLLAQPSGRGPAHRGVPLAAGPQGVAVLRRLVRQAQAHRPVRLGPAGDRRGPRGHRHHQDRRRVRPDQAQVDAAPVGHAVQGAGLRQVRPGPDLQLDLRGRADRPPAVGGRRPRRTRTRRCRRSTC